MGKVLELEKVYKSYKLGFIPKKKLVLKGISFSINEGEIFGYLGPNGAGKTTTIKCILNLIFPDSGKITIFGEDSLKPRAREKVGFLPENPYFYDYLTGREFLAFYADLLGLHGKAKEDKIGYFLKLVGMERAADLQLRKYSRGMLQRIGLAQALLNDPALVILDEPMGGLDPIGRKEFRDIIVNLKKEGKTVFLSSHILQDIEMICDRVAIILAGEIINQGYLGDLISEKVLYTEIIVAGLPPSEFSRLGESVTSSGDRVLLRVYEQEKVDQVISLVLQKKGKIVSLIPRTETLEDIFVSMVRNQ
ncbi:MAG: ABC transporter ATP-binding protein [Acidobacteriota bacterium]|nr:ABC transporter ATP-binding protein [Acidobacteriota bacterium]MDW3229523.1 ABC transporter ATP-binding protein [Acidobacteriota bacterium]MDY0231161.1 ABC transporter ATP-binding protein [Candidatus Saccharicenans sp.]